MKQLPGVYLCPSRVAMVASSLCNSCTVECSCRACAMAFPSAIVLTTYAFSSSSRPCCRHYFHSGKAQQSLAL